MSGNTVTIPTKLTADLRSFLSDVADVAAFSSMRPRARMLAMSLTDALENGQPVNEAPPEPARVIELPRVPGRETATAVEALVAKTMLDMPPPISVHIGYKGGRCSIDTWARPLVGDVITINNQLSVRVYAVTRDHKKPDVFFASAIAHDDRGGPF